MTIYTRKALRTHIQELAPGDVIVGEWSAALQNAVLLIDLLQRGVICIPSPLCQLLSRSKVAQVDILGAYMHPLTTAVKRRKDLLDAMDAYASAGIGPVVTKEEHMHCGHGIRRWDHIEAVYSYLGLEKERYPFVLQPLMEDFTDVRVIMVGDFVEAYTRSNPKNFRGNLSTGGEHAPCELTREQNQFCRQIVERGRFPYAHLDLQIMSDGRLYFFEIALNGGIRASRMDRGELGRRKADRLDNLARQAHARAQQ